MIRCKHCKYVAEEIKIIGPILYAEGVVTIGPEDGLITAVSPFRAIHTIQLGQELKNPELSFVCSNCSFTGNKDQFEITATCIFTGEPTSNMVQTFTGRYAVVERHVADALRVFSLENSDWNSYILPEDMV